MHHFESFYHCFVARVLCPLGEDAGRHHGDHLLHVVLGAGVEDVVIDTHVRTEEIHLGVHVGHQTADLRIVEVMHCYLLLIINVYSEIAFFFLNTVYI